MEANTKDIRTLGQRFGACEPAIAWAMRECVDAADIWAKADATKLLWVATRRGVLTDAQLETFVRWALRETPPPAKDAARIAACLDGSD